MKNILLAHDWSSVRDKLTFLIHLSLLSSFYHTFIYIMPCTNQLVFKACPFFFSLHISMYDYIFYSKRIIIIRPRRIMTISFKPCSLFILLLLFPRPPFLRSVFVRRPSLKLDHPASLNHNDYSEL